MMQSDCFVCTYFKTYVEPDLKRKKHIQSAKVLEWLDDQYEKYMHHQASKHQNKFRDIMYELQT